MKILLILSSFMTLIIHKSVRKKDLRRQKKYKSKKLLFWRQFHLE